MRPVDAEHELHRLLAARAVEINETQGGFCGRGEDARTAWEAFKSLITAPVSEPFTDRYGNRCHVDEDLLLFEPLAGDSENDDPDVFYLLFTRQFGFADDDGEYLNMNGLTLEIQVPLPAELAGSQHPVIWGGAGPPDAREPWRGVKDLGPYLDAGEWTEAVERSEPITLAFARTPTGFNFSQTDY